MAFKCLLMITFHKLKGNGKQVVNIILPKISKTDKIGLATNPVRNGGIKWFRYSAEVEDGKIQRKREEVSPNIVLFFHLITS